MMGLLLRVFVYLNLFLSFARINAAVSSSEVVGYHLIELAASLDGISRTTQPIHLGFVRERLGSAAISETSTLTKVVCPIFGTTQQNLIGKVLLIKSGPFSNAAVRIKDHLPLEMSVEVEPSLPGVLPDRTVVEVRKPLLMRDILPTGQAPVGWVHGSDESNVDHLIVWDPIKQLAIKCHLEVGPSGATWVGGGQIRDDVAIYPSFAVIASRIGRSPSSVWQAGWLPKAAQRWFWLANGLNVIGAPTPFTKLQNQSLYSLVSGENISQSDLVDAFDILGKRQPLAYLDETMGWRSPSGTWTAVGTLPTTITNAVIVHRVAPSGWIRFDGFMSN